jgi:acyl-CoA reductase-like NAD-dependent aldehyde dehydrogenase
MDDAQIQAVIDRVMAELRQTGGARHQPLPSPPVGEQRPPEPQPPRHADNLFGDVDAAVEAARRAYCRLQDLPLSVRDQMIGHIRRTIRENAQNLAHEAWQETGMGRYEDKIEKVLLNANKAPGTEVLDTGAWSGDGGLTVVEFAPYGLLGSIIPSTNPISNVV